MFYIMSLPSIYCKPHLPFCRDPGPSGSLALKVLSANTNLYYVTHLPKVTTILVQSASYRRKVGARTFLRPKDPSIDHGSPRSALASVGRGVFVSLILGTSRPLTKCQLAHIRQDCHPILLKLS